jgi:signal recognition particle receptor subunit beta
MGGKTTNLNYIPSRIDGSQRGDLVSLATSSDRTLFFDFLPIQTVVINGYKTRFMLYTVPGQVIYNATRQLVLRSVDGIVFVADSQWEKMEENVESFKNLEDNLAKQNISIDEIPYVIQYNKRDLENVAPVNYLEYVLNNRKKRVQSFEVISSTGQNVFASLNAVSQILLHKFSKQSDAPKTAPPPVAIPVEPLPRTHEAAV